MLIICMLGFQVVKEDMANVNIIAFRRMNQMDISGNVITQLEYLSSLKVSFTHISLYQLYLTE